MASTFPSARTMSFFKAGICGSSWLFTFPEGLLYFPYIPEHDSVFPCGSDAKASAYNAEDRVRSLGWEGPLEKQMAIHSSTLAWKIPWMEERGRLQSMGSQRVGHD